MFRPLRMLTVAFALTCAAPALAAGPEYFIGSAMISTAQSIGCNFNGTAIPSGRTVWFNCIVKPNFTSATPVTIFFRNQLISFTANATSYSLPVPNAAVTFDPAATQATTTFDLATNTWITVTPTGLPGNEFMSGLAYPSPGLPGGIQPVTWSGNLYASVPDVSVSWTWAAAVYTSFNSDYGLLGVKPCDSNNASIYLNSHHAGTPENYTGHVVGGATGGGGSNFTGSLCSTQAVPAPTPVKSSSWGELKLLYR